MARYPFMLGVLVSLVLLTACGIAGPRTRVEESPQVTEILAMLERSGGLTGPTESLWVGVDGSVTLQSDAEDDTTPPQMISISQAELAALRSAVHSAEWQQLEQRYGQPTPDGFTYTIIAGDKQVTTYDDAPNPPILDQVLQQLNTIWQRAK